MQRQFGPIRITLFSLRSGGLNFFGTLVRPRLRFHLAGKLGIGEALAYHLTHGKAEAVRVLHGVAVVIPKSLFVYVPEQVERLNRDVGLYGALRGGGLYGDGRNVPRTARTCE